MLAAYACNQSVDTNDLNELKDKTQETVTVIQESSTNSTLTDIKCRGY